MNKQKTKKTCLCGSGYGYGRVDDVLACRMHAYE